MPPSMIGCKGEYGFCRERRTFILRCLLDPIIRVTLITEEVSCHGEQTRSLNLPI